MNKATMMRKDLSKNPKSFTSFVKENYQKLMTLSSNPEDLISFINEETKGFSVSEKYRNALTEKLMSGSVTQNQYYLTNAYLTGKGLSVAGI